MGGVTSIATIPGTNLSNSSLAGAVYGPELWPLLLPAPSIAAGGSYAMAGLSNLQAVKRAVRLGYLVGGSASGIQLSVQADADPAIVYSPNLGEMPFGDNSGVDVTALSSWTLNQQHKGSGTGGAQVAAGLWIWQPTAADLAAQMAQLGSTQSLSQVVGPVAAAAYARVAAVNPFLSSLRPESPAAIVAKEYTPLYKRLYTPLSDNAAAYAAVGNTGLNVFDIFPSQMGADFAVLEALSIQPGAGIATDGAQWLVSREGSPLIQEYCYPFSLVVGAGAPPYTAKCWIPGVTRLTLGLSTAVANQTWSASPMSALVGFYKFTPIVRYRWSLTVPDIVSVSTNPADPNYVSPEVRDAVLSGWM